MSEVSIISKITMRSIKVQPAKHATEGKATPIAIVMGQASGVKQVVDKIRGDVYESIVGRFEATNLESGEVFQSSTLYLPSGIHGMVENAVKQLGDDSNGTVDFALEIRAVKAANPAGYSYEAANLIKAEIVDPLQSLRDAITAKKDVPKLEEPAKSGKK